MGRASFWGCLFEFYKPPVVLSERERVKEGVVKDYPVSRVGGIAVDLPKVWHLVEEKTCPWLLCGLSGLHVAYAVETHIPHCTT